MELGSVRHEAYRLCALITKWPSVDLMGFAYNLRWPLTVSNSNVEQIPLKWSQNAPLKRKSDFWGDTSSEKTPFLYSGKTVPTSYSPRCLPSFYSANCPLHFSRRQRRYKWRL